MGQDILDDISSDTDRQDAWIQTNDALVLNNTLIAKVHNDTPETEVITRYGYSIGTMGFLVGDGIISEVIINPVIHPIPSHSEFLLGVINQRGTIVPVFDLNDLFADGLHNKESKTILILGQGNDTAGLLINDLPQTVQVTDIPCNDIVFPQIANEFIRPLFRVNNRCWAELDFQGLLASLAGVHSPATEETF